MGYDVIVLAGGRSTRFGSDKVGLLLPDVLDGLPASASVVCVGPARPARRPDVRWVHEDPPQSGPLAALAAGLAAGTSAVVVLVGADMPHVGRAVPALVGALAAAADDAPGAVLVDGDGRAQVLASAWRRESLARRLAAIGELGGRPLRLVLDGGPLVPVADAWGSARDIDTPADLALAASVGPVSSQPRVALVTGAGRGIGRIVTERLASLGYRVAAAARSVDELADLAAETGALAVPLDVRDAAAVAEAVAKVESELGPIQLLVNNAGIAGARQVSWEVGVDDWWSVFEVNMLGVFLCSRAVLPSMVAARSGRVLNVSSNAAFFRVDEEPFMGISSAYMASKAALIRYTDALAAELAPHGVKAFAISPGTVKTDMSSGLFADVWDDPDFWAAPELTADLIEFIETGALDRLSGRYLHARNDDWRGFADRVPELLAEDLLALRIREAP